jgi:hypothetical protein
MSRTNETGILVQRPHWVTVFARILMAMQAKPSKTGGLSSPLIGNKTSALSALIKRVR